MTRASMFLAAFLMAIAGGKAMAASWQYTLVGPASLLVDCPPCDRPSFSQPLRGAFTLTLQSSNADEQVYRVENLRAYVGAADNPSFLLTGSGIWHFTNGPAAGQTLVLNTLTTRADAYTNAILVLTNDGPVMSREFPVLEIQLTDTKGDAFEVWHAGLFAVPAREIWFSVAHNFTGADGRTGTAGDLLSIGGRFVRREGELLKNLGLMPGVGGVNVDALTINTNGEILFSLDQDIFSETIGGLHHGDLLSSKGSVFQRNGQLLAGFGLMPPVADMGLDAVAIQPDGEILFSLRTEVFSQTLGKNLRPGDLLSNRGRIFRSQEQLQARFQPTETGDFGLDAVYVWPHGEIWFSTERSFTDSNLGGIMAGDLLSDQGYVVFRNLAMMSAFSPLEDLADFGLDALVVVADNALPKTAPRITSYQWRQPSHRLELGWQGEGKVFQVETALSAVGPWLPVGEVEPAAQAALDFVSDDAPFRYFRLRQW